jgi:PAS domain S-box-containing protein
LAQLKTGIGVWDRNLRTGKMTLTPEHEALLGLEPGSMQCYADFRARVHPDDIARYEAERDAAVERRASFESEYRIIRRDGQVRWLVTRGGAFYDEMIGEPIRLVGNDADITERKIAELALAERNEQLALASKAAGVGCFAKDLKTGLITVSDGYAAIHELPEGTVQTTLSHWRTRVHPDDLPHCDKVRDRVLGNRERDYSFDYRTIRDGAMRWIESRGCVSYDEDGRPLHVVGINVDVTERKLTEARLSDALAAGQVVAFEWDAVTRQSRRSDSAERILGIVESGCFLRQVHPADRSDLDSLIANLSPGNPSYALTFRFARPDGREVWLEEEAKGEFDAAGRLLRIKGLTRDITVRRQAELALAERNLQLALAGRAALVGSYTYDPRTEMYEISEGCAAIRGLPESTTTLTWGEWWAGVHPDDAQRVQAFVNDAVSKGHLEYNVEYRIVRPGGEVRWIESRSFISYNGAGHPLRVVGVIIDVTERKRAEEHRRVLVSELDHRVKNTLATISTVASHTLETSGSMADFVAALNGRIKSMASTHELLSSRHWDGIPLTELVRSELAPYANAGNTRIEGPDVVLRADAGQILAMVFHELATNAAKFGAISTKSGRVSVRWSGGAESWLKIHWVESGGPPVVQPTRSGFGTSVIRELVPYELSGTVELAHLPEGLCCNLHVPAQWLSASVR